MRKGKDYAFELRDPKDAARAAKSKVHVYGKGVRCVTDSRGFPTPKNRNPAELVLNAPGGFIPLWEPDVTLRWRFQERSMSVFEDPQAAAAEMRLLFGDALLAWGEAVPVRFAEREDRCDFEIVVKAFDDCDPNGCVLASAFFPDAGRHKLVIYPQMFTQSRKEQVDTFIHEIGHTFGLRHFFAQIKEKSAPSEVFGAHRAFSIMNYGNKSQLTKADKSDLKKLYDLVWGGQLIHINGTHIKLVKPFSAASHPTDLVFALNDALNGTRSGARKAIRSPDKQLVASYS